MSAAVFSVVLIALFVGNTLVLPWAYKKFDIASRVKVRLPWSSPLGGLVAGFACVLCVVLLGLVVNSRERTNIGGTTITLPEELGVAVKNVGGPITNTAGSTFKFNAPCNVHAGSTVTSIGTDNSVLLNNLLVRYHTQDDAERFDCPDGTVFFMEHALFNRLAEGKDWLYEEKERIRRLLANESR